jgi:tRNA (guanine37-N1)-methyltransferase
MNFYLISLFPDSFDSYVKESIIKRAIEDKKIKISVYNPRDFAENIHDRIDRKAYGGGPGMVIQAMPVIKAIEKAIKDIPISRRKKVKIIFLSPGGKQFDTLYAKKTSKKYKEIIIVCGRYEGIDARVKKIFKMEEVSVGPFVLTGGELGALILIDSISRQIPGVLGDFDSLEENRNASSDVYTRPEIIEYKKKKYSVPKVLISGNHKKIEEWRMKH